MYIAKNYSVMKYLKNNDIKFKINDFSKFCNRLVSLTKVQKNLIVVHYLNIRTRIRSSTARSSCNRLKFATVIIFRSSRNVTHTMGRRKLWVRSVICWNAGIWIVLTTGCCRFLSMMTL